MSREQMMNMLNATPKDFGVKVQETVEDKIKYFTDFVENYMNETVQTRKYDSIDTCIARYYNSDVEKYRNEARAVCSWVGRVWQYCEQVQSDVLAGKRDIPTEQELINELPILNW